MTDNLSGVLNIDIIGGYLCLDFSNTVHSYHTAQPADELQNYTDLVLWSRRMGLLSGPDANALLARSPDPEKANAVLARAKSLRRLIFAVFSPISEGKPARKADLAGLGDLWAEAIRHARITVTPSGYEWAWESGRDTMDGMLWPIVRSAIDLLISDVLPRIRACDAENCTWLFVDKSKNRSRRWCEMGSCGNRAKSRRHYQRTRSGSHEPPD